MTMLTVTRRAAIAHNACFPARVWAAIWLADHGGDDDTPIPLAVVLDSPGGLDWAVWALRCAEPVADRDRIARLFAADCTARVATLVDYGWTSPPPVHAATSAAAYDAVWATWSARCGAGAVLGAAAQAAEVAWQTDRLRLYLAGAELPPVGTISTYSGKLVFNLKEGGNDNPGI